MEIVIILTSSIMKEEMRRGDVLEIVIVMVKDIVRILQFWVVGVVGKLDDLAE